MQYMSIITNFGCHYKCPYCIVKENNLHIPRTTLAGLDNLEEALKENGCNIVSISGGGDPLHEYEKHVDWY
jgi:organic radical activating enzyme